MVENKKEIISEVGFLLALKKGFNNVSIKEIRKASGFSAGLIYYYFKDKNEILVYIVDTYFLNNLQEFKESIKNSHDSFMKKIENILYYMPDFNKKEFKSSHSLNMLEFSYKEY
jgi:AcrR family transcriptional regulator